MFEDGEQLRKTADGIVAKMLAAAFASQPIPKGNRIAIVTNDGGPGIMATDAAIRHGLKIAPLSKLHKLPSS